LFQTGTNPCPPYLNPRSFAEFPLCPIRIWFLTQSESEHIEPGSRRNPEATINMLLFLLDRREVVLSGAYARVTGCAS
jgi:hypothetical protein